MCDDVTDREVFEHALLARRDLWRIAGAMGIGLAFPGIAKAADAALSERRVDIPTPDGSADAYLVAPARGRHPAVILWPDIYGLRAEVEQVAHALAAHGYAVLAVNPFYRSIRAPVAATGTPKDADLRARIAPMRALLTPEATARDASAFAAFLDREKVVDRKRGVGTLGYCMGGSLVFRTAAALPGRVKAAVSFHGGALATDQAESPHLLIPRSKASYLVAVAENDDQRFPDDKARLRTAFDAAGRDAEIEVYTGALHGWCMPDNPAFQPELAERAWHRLLALFSRTLA